MNSTFIYSLLVCFSFTFVVIESRRQCMGRTGKSTNYCVCNTTYCDDLDPIVKQNKGSVLVFQTNKNGDRFKETKLQFSKSGGHSGNQIVLTIDKSKKYQKILGIGAAFTDAAAINIDTLPKALAENVIKDYFGPNGIEYSMARVPIAGTDFSTRVYTYDDSVSDDFELKSFKLQKEDTDHKIPNIQLANKVSARKLRLYGSPWVTPNWLMDKQKLKTEADKHYKTWAQYFIKFLDSYKAKGIEFWGLTMQNEPKYFPSMNFRNASVERDFTKTYLGPALAKAGYGKDKLNLMVYDDGISPTTNPIDKYVDTCLSDKDSAKYVTGIAYHCYGAGGKNWDLIDSVHKKYPNFFILMTECCQAFRADTNPLTPASLGDWNYASAYAGNVMNTLHHGISGWVEWNLALDTFGHPNHDKKMSESPVIVDAKKKEYYKNPNFYVLGHYSKFIIPDSVRVGVNSSKTQNYFDFIAFERPDKSVVLVVYNLGNKPIDLVITDPSIGSTAHKLGENEIQSYIYWN